MAVANQNNHYLTIVEARNPRWVNENHDSIDLEVNFSELPEDWLPYTCHPTDVCTHSRSLYTRAVAKEFGDVSTEYVLSEEDKWTPVSAVVTEVSPEALVQILLEKGVISDDDVDSILVDKVQPLGFTKPTKDGSNPVYHSPMLGSGGS